MSVRNKIDMQNVEDVLALTSMQEGILYHYLSNPISEQYYEQLSLLLSGQIEIEAVKKTWNFIAETNEMLRAVFRWQKLRKPVQIIQRNFKVNVKLYDFSRLSEIEKKMAIENTKEIDRGNGFDLSAEPFRVILCKIKENKYEMIISYHHILYDGWSNSILINEFIKAYSIFYKGGIPLKPIKTKVKDYIKWLNNRDKEAQSVYWKEYIRGFDEKTQLPMDGKQTKCNEVSSYDCILPPQVVEKVTHFIINHEVTLASLLYTVWGILLKKYNNTEDVVFGITVSGRTHEIKGIDKIVGLFINTIPLRVRTSKNEKVIDVLKKMNMELIEQEEYQHTPLVEIKSYSEISQNESLFDSIVVIENYPVNKSLTIKDENVEVCFSSVFGFTSFDLTLRIMAFDGIKLEFVYNRLMFKSCTIERLANYYIKILTEIIEQPDKVMSQFSILPEKEEYRILKEFNNTHINFNKLHTIKALFEEQVKRVPEHAAVVYQGKRMTYRELYEFSNHLAQKLHDIGILSGEIVGIMVENSLEMIVGILGVLIAGGAYLPIDSRYPKDRVAYMLDDSKAKLLITSNTQDTNTYGNVLVIPINSFTFNHKLHHVNSTINPHGIAYVIYTSGTTGKPKGIAVKNEGLANYSLWFSKYNNVTEKDKTVLLSSFCFDLGYTSIYPTLLSGGELHIIPRELYLDSKYILNYIKENGITYIKLTPSLFSTLINNPGFYTNEYLKRTRLIVLGGEEINVADVENLYRTYPGVNVINHYGPTETTIGCIAKFIEPSLFEEFKKRPVIGRPISNTQVYILDKCLNLVPIGAPGEICIAGRGVSEGYISNNDLTTEKFIPNPFSKKGGKLYKTGDVGRFLQNGDIEFLGRSDHQIKIRGYRIELREIEIKLTQHSSVKEAFVTVKEGKMKNKLICAYIVLDLQLSVKDIKEYLSGMLPEYMLPAFIIIIDKMPLTPNGKVDINFLPEPNSTIETNYEYVVPVSEVEKRIELIWSEILGIDNIGINDNFFDLGGNSILLINMHNAIEQYYPNKISIMDIFSNSTIMKLAKLIEKNYFKEQNEKTLNRISFPPKYFSNYYNEDILNGRGAYNILDHSLNKSQNEVLYQLSRKENVDLNAIFLSIFMFLLSEISKKKNIEIQITVDNKKAFPLSIDLAEVEDFTSLFKVVSEEIVKSRNDKEYVFSELNSKNARGDENTIVPAFNISKNTIKDCDVIFLFDILMEIYINQAYFGISLHYNNLKFNVKSIEELFKKYLDLIEILLDEYNH